MQEQKKPSRQLEWQRKMRANGRCIQCGNPAWREGSDKCNEHRAQQNARYHARKKEQ